MIPNKIELTKPYALSRVRFLRQFYSFAKERYIENSAYDLSEYETILGLNGAKQFKPAMFQAIINRQENNLAIEEGLRAVPQIIVPPIAVDENLPVEAPIRQEIPARGDIERWKLQTKLFKDFKMAKSELKEMIKNLLPTEVFQALERKGGNEGWANVNPEMIFDYILSHEFAHLTEGEIDAAYENIRRPWKRNLTLKENIDSMVEANNILGASFPTLKLTDGDLFRSAMKIAKSPSYRLIPTVNKFMDSKQHYATSSFNDFATYLLANYRNHIHTEDNGHLAFICEDGYKENNRPYALANVGKTDDEGLAFAANVLPPPSAAKANLPSWKAGEYEEYLDLKRNKSKILDKQFIVPPPPPGAPAGAKFGKLCFNCGWNRDHNSKRCPIMVDNPKFSSKMKKLVRFDPKKDTPTIDGIPINLSCAPGVYGTY